MTQQMQMKILLLVGYRGRQHKLTLFFLRTVLPEVDGSIVLEEDNSTVVSLEE